MDPSRDPSPERGDSPHRNPTRGPSVTDGKHRSALSSQLYAQPDHGPAKTATWVVAIADTASATVMGNHGPLLRITSIRKPTLRRQPTRPTARPRIASSPPSSRRSGHGATTGRPSLRGHLQHRAAGLVRSIARGHSGAAGAPAPLSIHPRRQNHESTCNLEELQEASGVGRTGLQGFRVRQQRQGGGWPAGILTRKHDPGTQHHHGSGEEHRRPARTRRQGSRNVNRQPATRKQDTGDQRVPPAQ